MPMWVAQVHRQRGMLLCMGMVALSALPPLSAHAIDLHPTAKQIQTAINQGKEAAREGKAPDSFYVRFGVSDAVTPRGFLVTKLAALSVLATHMALRGLQPSEADVAQILDAQTMLVSTTIFGNAPNFAVNSYMVLEQHGKVIKPATVRFDAKAEHSARWPNAPMYKAKVVASFNYRDFDPMAQTMISVFPATGGEASFPMSFVEID